MARQAKKLAVQYTHKARSSLLSIWDWNAERYDSMHADRFLGFLKQEIDKLSEAYKKGIVIPFRPELRSKVITKRANRFGYVVIYRILDESVEVMQILHTARDWQNQIDP